MRFQRSVGFKEDSDAISRFLPVTTKSMKELRDPPPPRFTTDLNQRHLPVYRQILSILFQLFFLKKNIHNSKLQSPRSPNENILHFCLPQTKKADFGMCGDAKGPRKWPSKPSLFFLVSLTNHGSKHSPTAMLPTTQSHVLITAF